MAAPSGGGGGGGPVGFANSFTGPSEALELVGNHAMAYSGNVGITSSNITMLKFTSGNYYFVGGLELHGDFQSIAANNTVTRIVMNNSEIVDTIHSTINDNTLMDYPIQLIIPAYTEFELTMAQGAGGTLNMQATLVGRIYR